MSHLSDRDLIDVALTRAAIESLPLLRRCGLQEALIVLADHRLGDVMCILICDLYGETLGIDPLDQAADDFLHKEIPGLVPGANVGLSAWADVQPWQIIAVRRLSHVGENTHVN